jgi:hypothetical protein
MSAAPLRAAMLAAALLLSGCGGGGGKSATQAELTFTPIAAGAFAVQIDPNANVPRVEAAFRKKCPGTADCTILGWTDAGTLAHALPLGDRQVTALAVRFDRHPGSEDVTMWDCVRFRTAKAPCLPKA